MRLVIQRNQSKGMMGGVAFEVRSRLELTPEERTLVDHYGLNNEVITISNKKSLLTGQPVSVRVKNLVSGDVFKAKNLGEVKDYSDEIVETCQLLKVYMAEAKKFKGDEVIEI